MLHTTLINTLVPMPPLDAVNAQPLHVPRSASLRWPPRSMSIRGHGLMDGRVRCAPVRAYTVVLVREGFGWIPTSSDLTWTGAAVGGVCGVPAYDESYPYLETYAPHSISPVAECTRGLMICVHDVEMGRGP